MSEDLSSLKWSDIEANLSRLEKVEGGYSNVKKGLLRLAGDKLVFVKIATDPDNKKWTKKEVAMYRFLALHNYKHVPKLLVANNDDTGFVLEAITETDGWDWLSNWSEERLNTTLNAMADLAGINISDGDINKLEIDTISERDNGWRKLNSSSDMQKVLRKELEAIDRSDILEVGFDKLDQKSEVFIFNNDTLVHYDIRADNCAWNEQLKKVRLIDWNWTQIGDVRIDKASLFSTVKKSGFNIDAWLKDLDPDALLWMAGFWLAAASTPIWPKGPTGLRDSQLISGITAFDLATEINPAIF